jgi:hypothetical protein
MHELNEIEAVLTLIQALEKAKCPPRIMEQLKEWALDLSIDREKYLKWIKMCK